MFYKHFNKEIDGILKYLIVYCILFIVITYESISLESNNNKSIIPIFITPFIGKKIVDERGIYYLKYLKSFKSHNSCFVLYKDYFFFIRIVSVFSFYASDINNLESDMKCLIKSKIDIDLERNTNKISDLLFPNDYYYETFNKGRLVVTTKDLSKGFIYTSKNIERSSKIDKILNLN